MTGPGILALATLAGAGMLAVAAGIVPSPPPDDRRVPLPDGRRMHLVCEGRGTPVVVFDGGWRAGADAWAGIRHRVAARTTACSYDRAGYGTSDPGPRPRDAGAEAADFAALLKAARLPPPYLLVGHSLGGLVAQAYAARPDARLAGMLLLDSSIPHQTRVLGAAVPAYGAQMTAWEARLRTCADTGLACRATETRTLASEIAEMPGRSSAAIDAGPPGYGALPLIVLTAGRSMIPGGPPVAQAALDGTWRAAHAAIAARSTRGAHRILADTGHLIPKERPDAVVAAIDALLDTNRPRD